MQEKIQIRSLDSLDEFEQLEEVQRQVWPGSETDVVPTHLLLTIAKNGGVVLGAFDGDRMVGFVFGFLGTDDESPNRVAMARLKHCSHQLGVLPDYRSSGVGYRLKLAQREAVLQDGIRLITWTYDPLLSNNAYLNIRLLGAVVGTYLRNMYGLMRNGLNVGIPSDRFQVEWWVTTSRVTSRIEALRPPLDLANFLGAGAQKLNPVVLDEDGLPMPPAEFARPEGNLLLVEIPPDFQALKKANIHIAQAWRQHTRDIFEHVFKEGYLVTDFIYLKEERFPRSYYVLSHGESRLG